MNLNRSCLSIGLVIAALLIVMGTYSLSLTEGLINTYSTPEFWGTPDLKVAWLQSPTPTATITQTPTPCPMPEGWVVYQIQPGDSAEQLSINRGFTLDLIQLANCQAGRSFQEGQLIFLPAFTVTPTRTFTITPSSTPIICPHPQGWSVYVVKDGDTPFSLSLKYNIGIVELQKANCLKENEELKPGQRLYLPLPAAELPPPPTSTFPPPTLTPTIEPTITPLIIFTAPPA
jgi:LysM repeat protein